MFKRIGLGLMAVVVLVVVVARRPAASAPGQGAPAQAPAADSPGVTRRHRVEPGAGRPALPVARPDPVGVRRESHRGEGPGRDGHSRTRSRSPRPPRPARPTSLGQGWKVRPFLRVNRGQTATLMDVAGPGVIQHIWMVEGLSRARPAVLLGRRGDPLDRGPRARLLRGGPRQVRPGALAGRGREPAECPELLLADAVPQARAGHAHERVADEDLNCWPTRSLRRDRGARPAGSSTPSSGAPAPTGRTRTSSSTGSGPRALRGHVPGLDPASRAGSARGRSSSTSTATASSPPSAARAPRITSAAATASRAPTAARTRAPRCRRTTTPSRPASGACTAGTSWTRSTSSTTCA